MPNTDVPENGLPPATRLTLINALADFVLEEVAVQGGPYEGCPFIDDAAIDTLDPIRYDILLPVWRQILETFEHKSDAELRAYLRDAQSGRYSRKGHWRWVNAAEVENSGEMETIKAESRS